MDWSAVLLSLRLAALTATVLFILGVPLAYAVATMKSRWKAPIEALVTLPILLPPTVLGFYILVAMGPRSPLGALAESLFGAAIPFSFAGILIASILFNMPFAVRPFVAAFQGVDRRLIEASYCLGESRVRTFARITLPLAWPGLLTGVVLSFAHTVGEFGVVLMVGGSIPGKTRTIAIDLYDKVQSMDYAGAHRTAALLLAMCFGALLLTFALQRRGGRA